MEDTRDDYLVNLMDQNTSGFLNMLNRNVIKGDNSKDETLKQLRVISTNSQCIRLLCDFRDTSGDSLIHNVAKFHRSTEVMRRLLKTCPSLVLLQRTDRFQGQTALHIVVTKMNLRAARVMLKCVQTEHELRTLLHTCATGTLFANTVMMGELVLSVAALTLNINMVDLLLKFKADISAQNGRGDTVFHSLIRFAAIHHEKLDVIIQMIEHINSKLAANLVSKVWYNTTNREDLTALKLAASLGQVEIFSRILKLEDVYCKLNHHDGLFDIYLFDITEIDTITQAEWERNKKREGGGKKDVQFPAVDLSYAKKKPAAQSHRPALIHRCPAVLDIICRMPTAVAFDLMSVDVVNDLITTKWKHYSHFYYLWFLCHFVVLVLITVYAVFKTHVINDHVYPSVNSSTIPNVYELTSTQHTFVFLASVLCVLYAFPYLVYEAFRSFYFKQAWHVDVIHHNCLYRLMMLFMALFLVADTVWFWIDPDNNYFLVLALLLGWTFMNFFLRAQKIFSFFTVMLQKVLLGDMTRFSVIIIFQLVAFSIGMYITFLNTKPVPPGFENVGMAAMTMFKLMLGLTEFEVLYDARHSWMAIFLFVSCVLVTYVLLINSLIALMSQTCALVSEDRRMQWELQRLSVIHLVETMLLPRWRYLHKPGLKARRYNLYNQATEWRCFHEVTSIQTTYTDGAAIFRRKSMIRTIGFGDSVFSPLAPFTDRLRGGRNSSPGCVTPLYQNPATLMDDLIEEESDDDEETVSYDGSIKSPENRLSPPAIIPEIIAPVETKVKTNQELFQQSSFDKEQQRGWDETDNPRAVNNQSRDTAVSSSSKQRKISKGSGHETTRVISPNFLSVQTSPRKRHNSETVSRKTQTAQTGHLSHSYPDGGLRTPLHGMLEPESNARIVYVVPTSLMNQQLSHLQEGRPIATDRNISTATNNNNNNNNNNNANNTHASFKPVGTTNVQFEPDQQDVTSSDPVYAKVVKPRKRARLSSESHQRVSLEERDDRLIATCSSLPNNRVQTLDIGTLAHSHSHSNA